MVVFDERKGQVDTRRNPSRGIESPSRTKIASGSTLIRGKARDSRPVCRQWVVARRPSSIPVCAKMNDPVQIDAIRRVRGRRSATAATSRGSIGRPTRSSPPETTVVSTVSIEPIEVETAIRVPTDVTTSSPSTEAMTTR